MAIFGKDGKDRDRNEGGWDPGIRPIFPPVLPPPVREEAPREVKMNERERDTTQLGGPGGINAFFGKGSQITGKLVFEGQGRIEGQVEGEISAQDTLTIGESAVVNAQISGTCIIVQGRVTGDITARQRLELRAPCRVHGNITAPSLIVQEGAFFEGQCAMRVSETATLGEKKDTSVLLHPDKRPDTPAAKPGGEVRPITLPTAAVR